MRSGWEAPWWSTTRTKEEPLGAEKKIKLLCSMAEALKEGDKTLLLSVLDSGMDCDTVFHDGGHDRPAVFLAVERGHVHLVEILCARGCSLSTMDSTGLTPLHLAASKGYTDIVLVLLNYRAQVNTPSTRGGNTPLQFAAASNHHQVVQHLVEQGADVNQQNLKGMTSLMNAANRGHLKTVKTLVEHGADLDIVDNDGNTALLLHCSSVSVNADMVDMLATSPMLINKSNKQGYSPVMQVATSHSRQTHKALHIMTKLGADLGTTTFLGDTPLHIVCKVKDWVSAQILVRAGAKLDQQNYIGENPLQLALKQDNLPLAGLMRNGGAQCSIAPEFYRGLSVEAKLWLMEQQKKTKSLKEFSRLVVRKMMPRPLESSVNDAELPNTLKQYVKFLL